MLDGIGKPLDVVLLLDVSDEVSLERLLGRRAAEGRSDDAPEAIRNRLRLYHELTEPVVERYRTKGMLVPVDGERPVEDVAREIGDARAGGSAAGVIIRKSEREIEKIARRRPRRGDDRARARRSRRASPRASSTRSARSSSAATAASRLARLRRPDRPLPERDLHLANEVVVHGIPGPYEVAEGDLVTIDVGVTLDAYIADSAYTFGVGEIAPEAQRLLEVAQALAAGIGEARVDNRVGDISHGVQPWSRAPGFSVVKSLVGHGVGRHYHEDPHIPNFGQPGRGPRLSEGMTIAIEPMITMGGAEVTLAGDAWTIATADGSLSAHFEHTVAITADGPRILTPRVGLPGGVRVEAACRSSVASGLEARDALAEVAQHHAFDAVEPRVEPVERCVHAIERARSGLHARERRERETIVAACAHGDRIVPGVARLGKAAGAASSRSPAKAVCYDDRPRRGRRPVPLLTGNRQPKGLIAREVVKEEKIEVEGEVVEALPSRCSG